MPNKSISGIRDYLGAQLSTLLPSSDGATPGSPVGLLLALTYDEGASRLMDVRRGHQVEFDGYPAARYYYLTTGETLKDQKNQWRTYVFRIDLIYRIGGEDKSEAELILEDAMEAVLNALDEDYTLGGYADNAMISAEPIREIDSPFGVALLLPITVSAQVLLFFP